MRKTEFNCLKVVVALLLTMLINGCGSEKETTAVSTTSPSAVYAHSAAMSLTTIYTWGANSTDQLGNNITTGAIQPSPQPAVGVGGIIGTTLTEMTGVSAGGSHSLAFNSATGNVYSWGNNGFGQLGNNSNTISPFPVQVVTNTTGSFLTGIQAVSAGGNHSIARDSSSNVWAWGDNTYGELGVSTATLTTRLFADRVINPLTGLPFDDITMIAAGGVFSLALSSTGTVWSWGYNSSGQLGHSSNTIDSIDFTPARVLNVDATGVPTGVLSSVAQIAAGGSHSLFRLADGTVWACGNNLYGQLGDGTIIDRKTGAVQVQGLPASIPVTQIAAGLAHSLALINGQVWAWGLNDRGQLGNGQALLSAAANSTPSKVKENADTELSGVTKIIAIGHHNLALKSDGTLWVWGENSSSQLGLGAGDTTDRNFAVQVPVTVDGIITNWDLYVQQ